MDSLISQAIADHAEAHNKHCAAAGFATAGVSAEKAESTWGEVVNAAKEKGITPIQILSIIGPILNMIFAGNPVSAIIAQILAILNPPTPAPAA